MSRGFGVAPKITPEMHHCPPVYDLTLLEWELALLIRHLSTEKSRRAQELVAKLREASK